MRPSRADTSDPAWVKRKMLSTKNSTSWPWSRKCSATVRPVRPTRARAPGGSFICPNTSAHFDFTFGSGLCGSALKSKCALVFGQMNEHERTFRFHIRIGIMRIGIDLRFDELVIEVVALA